eukprot:6278691-Prymnesium_polylepis.1
MEAQKCEMEATARTELNAHEASTAANAAAADQRLQRAAESLHAQEEAQHRRDERSAAVRHAVAERLCRMRGRNHLLATVLSEWRWVCEMGALERSKEALEVARTQEIERLEQCRAMEVAAARADGAMRLSELTENATELEESRAVLAHKAAVTEASLTTARADVASLEEAAAANAAAMAGQRREAAERQVALEAERSANQARLTGVRQLVVERLHRLRSHDQLLASV